MEIIHSFAKQVLYEQGISVYVGHKQILKYTGRPQYSTSPLDTKLLLGERLTISDEIQIIKDYRHLKEKLGLVIRSRKLTPRERVYAHQRVLYYLDKVSDSKDVGEIPDRYYEHYVEYDVQNQAVRLRGKNAGLGGLGDRGHWINLKRKKSIKQRRKKVSIQMYRTESDNIINSFKRVF